MPTRITPKVCLHCHTQFQGGTASQYCPDCRHVQHECLYCGKSFAFHRWNPMITCSNRCGQLFRWRNVEALRAARRPPCANCGSPITRRNWTYGKRKHEHSFCSTQCYGKWRTKHINGERHPNWRGGRRLYYGPSWPPARKKARRRDNYTCQRCSVTEAEIGQHLHVHHIIPFHEFGVERHKEANASSNLLCLCRSCHSYIRHNRNDS